MFARFPNHPGAHHYIIHAYDYPPLAGRALEVARAYGRIAPEVPHALHMPTHIFTRLGLWEDSIDWNKRSAAAALANPVAGAVSLHYLHALDYLAYSYLQRGEDDKAAQVRATLQRPAIAGADGDGVCLCIGGHSGAPRTRASELGRGHGARAGIAAVVSVGVVSCCRGDYALRSRARRRAQLVAAHWQRESLERLAELRDRANVSNAYWGTQVEIQRLAASAWLTLAEGQRSAALATMRQAADLESSTEKHPVTPGEVLPARELLADMLLEVGEYAAARKEYAATLERSPNRFNSVYGIARSAELAGDEAVAIKFYRQLIELTRVDTK